MMQYIATEHSDTVIMVEDNGDIQWAINPQCPEWADYEEWAAIEKNTLIPAQPSEYHYMVNGVWQVDAPAARKALQERNRAECKQRILARYPLEIQASMAAEIYNEAERTAYHEYLTAMIAEENRVYDLLEVADDPTTVENPNWPEVE